MVLLFIFFYVEKKKYLSEENYKRNSDRIRRRKWCNTQWSQVCWLLLFVAVKLCLNNTQQSAVVCLFTTLLQAEPKMKLWRRSQNWVPRGLGVVARRTERKREGDMCVPRGVYLGPNIIVQRDPKIFFHFASVGGPMPHLLSFNYQSRQAR